MRPDFFYRSLYDLAALGTLFSGLTLALLVGFAKRPGLPANLFLSLALGVIVLKTGGLSAAFLPALGPLLFFYTRHLTRPEWRFQRNDWLHFCPLLGGLWMPVWLIFMSVILYLFLSHRLIQAFYGRLRPVLMDRPRFAFRGLDKALVLLGWSCLLTLMSDSFFLAIAFVLMGMAVAVILKSDGPVKLTMPGSDRSDARQKGRKLKEAVAANHLYEDAELTLTTLAVKLAIHPHDLSRIINVGLEKNFSDFINEFRIREIARKMRDPAYDRLTLLGIAYESGFNSKTTFNRVFKQMTGQTPVEYKNSLKKEVPIDELAPVSPIQPLLLRSGSPPTKATDISNRTIASLHPVMLRNYVKIAWRNFLRSKSFSAINMVGLSVGMTCCMLLMLYIRSELSFDKHHQYAPDLYLVKSDIIYPTGTQEQNPRQSSPYAAALKAAFLEVMQVTRLKQNFSESKTLLQLQQPGKRSQSYYETNGYQVDSTFFDVFSYHFTEGDAKTALQDVHSVVLSDAMARKLFGKAPALNNLIRINGSIGNGETFKVTGVFRDESAHSHIDAHFFVPMMAGWVGGFLREQSQNFYYNNMFFTYLRLRPGSDASQLNAKLPAFIEKYAREGLKSAGFDKRISLVAVPDLHLYGSIQEIVTPTTSSTYLYILASIALFTLLIACINFMNLATARSAKRAAEVGIRKVLGAGRGGLIRQFLGESMVVSLLALVFAIGLVALLLPVFNQLTGKQLAFADLIDPTTIGTFIGLALLTGLLAGSYPAFYLSVFNPVHVLKGRFANSISAIALRRGLVVFQFVISIGLVVATLVIQQQMRFLRNQPLGFTKDQQLIIPLRSDDAHKAYTALRNEIQQSHQVIGAAGAKFYPGIISPSDVGLYRPDQNAGQVQYVKTNFVDQNFMHLMGFQLLKGRLFSAAFPADSNSRIVVNEAALRKLGVPLQKAIGYKLNYGDEAKPSSLEIVGVVRDFHFEDLHQPIQPYAFLLMPNPFSYNYLIVHVNTAQVGKVLAFVEQKWKTLLPDEPFEYSFLDEDFQRNYQADGRTSSIVNYFTLIAILISCLGLFGLAAFAAQQRTKEIGVRKVLGASVGSIVGLLSKDFLRLVLIAIVIASPLAWYVMDKWLQGFAYKITLSWWVFALAGLLAVGIALLTVSFQAIKAALINPVKSLRSE